MRLDSHAALWCAGVVLAGLALNHLPVELLVAAQHSLLARGAHLPTHGKPLAGPFNHSRLHGKQQQCASVRGDSTHGGQHSQVAPAQVL
jgi:hypothetical protein